MAAISRERLVEQIHQHADKLKANDGFTSQTGWAQVRERKPGESKDEHIARIVRYGEWYAMRTVASFIKDKYFKG